MQQDKHNIDKKLQQLENQQLPDLSQMDKHWQEMQRLLDTDSNKKPVVPLPATAFNWKRIAIAAAVIGLLALVLYNTRQATPVSDKKPSNELSSLNTKQEPAINSMPEVNDQSTGNALVNNNKSSGSINDPVTASNNPVVSNKKPGIVVTGGLINANPANGNSASLIRNNNAAMAIPAKSAAEMMGDFYTVIRTPVQQFDIEAAQGGTLTCKAGTTLRVPAMAFTDKYGRKVDGAVRFTIQELYKYTDVVSAHMTTTSGGKQLVTGGMLYVTANAGGQALQLSQGKGIGITVPTNHYDPRMQLFTSGSEDEQVKSLGDSLNTTYIHNRIIDWKPEGSKAMLPPHDGKTNFYFPGIDIGALLSEKKENGKVRLRRQAPVTVKQIKEAVKRKYGDDYVVMDVQKDGPYFRILGRGMIDSMPINGDSVRITLKEALSRKIIDPMDSTFYARKIRRDSTHFVEKMFAQLASAEMSRLFGPNSTASSQLSPDQQAPLETSKLDKVYADFFAAQKVYQFTIYKLGWINCARFTNYPNYATLTINLPEGVNAEKFVSQLVFSNIKSVLPGIVQKNSIVFHHVPRNLQVHLVGLGEKDNKLVSFFENITVTDAQYSVAKLEETTPAVFRQKIETFD